MFKQAITTSLIGIGLFFSGSAMAHSNSHHHNHHDYQSINVIQPARHCVSGKRVDNRQANQKRRIRKGIRQGKLVGWEIHQVKKQQRRIRKTERRMRKSGHCLTRHEVKKLLNRLDRAGHKIKQLKTNNVRRGHGRHRHNRHNNRNRSHR